MKKVFYPLACCCLAAGVFASCGGQKKANAPEEQKVALSYSKSLKAPETDSLNLTVDKDGYITIFDGETFNCEIKIISENNSTTDLILQKIFDSRILLKNRK